MDIKIMSEVQSILHNEGFKVFWYDETTSSVSVRITRGVRHTVKRFTTSMSVKGFCKDIIADFKKAHYTLDDITNIEDLFDFCRQHNYVVELSRAQWEPSVYTVSRYDDKIVRHVVDTDWSSEKQVCFIKNMMRALNATAVDMTERDIMDIMPDPNLDVKQLYPKIFCARGNGKSTRDLASYINALCGVPKLNIDKVIFNEPATIVMWKDGTKTVVKAEGEAFDPEKGLAMAISKKALGNKRDYYHTFLHWLKKYDKEN